MSAIQIPDELNQQIDAFALTSGESKEHLVREALSTYLADRRDASIAAERLGHSGQRISLADIGKEFDLAD